MRHLLLSSLLLLSGCSLIRISGLPVAATKQPTKEAVKSTTLAVTTVPAEGIVRRVQRSDSAKCTDGLYAYSTIAEVELTAPATDWTLRNLADGRAKAFVLTGERACPTRGQPEERVSLPAGRHRIAIVWHDGSDQARWEQTFAFFPGEKPDPLLHAEIPEKLKLEDRDLSNYYPFLESPTQALEVAPKQMFVFARPGSYGTPTFHGTVSSQWNDQAPNESVTMLANEPLLLMRGGTGTYLAADLTEFRYVKISETPDGAVTMPEKTRGSWLGFESLMEEAEGPQKRDVEAFRKKWSDMKNCVSGAIGRFNTSTVNVIITPKQREAASVKLDKERKLCREKETEVARDALKEKLLEARRADVQKRADALRPRVQSMF